MTTMNLHIKTKPVLLTALIAAGLSLTACKKGYFDAVPKDLVSVEIVFKDKTETENWLAGVYAKLYDVWNNSAMSTRYSAAFTEELELATPSIQANNNLSPVTAINVWTANYQGIRLANIFMANVDNSKTNLLREPNGKELIQQYTGEARF